jgi:hypothetical protein
MKNSHKGSAENPVENISFRKHRNRCEDNIKTDLNGTGLELEHCINLTQNKDQWWSLADTVTNHRVP